MDGDKHAADIAAVTRNCLGTVDDILFLGTGLFFTVKSGGFQIRKLPYWWKKTVGSLGNGSVSSFQTSCTALAATIGTGNIVGVATALTAPVVPGAVFWLWISAFICMATAYAETSLGQKYRYSQAGWRVAVRSHGVHGAGPGLPEHGTDLCAVCGIGVSGDGMHGAGERGQ